MKGKISVAGLEEATESLPEETLEAVVISKIEPEIKSERTPLSQKALKIAVRPLKRKIPSPVESITASEVTKVVVNSEEKPIIKPAPLVLVRPAALKSRPRISLVTDNLLQKGYIAKRPTVAVEKNQPTPAKTQPSFAGVSSTSFKPRSVATKESKKTIVTTGSSGWLTSLSLLVCASVLAVLLVVTKQEIFSTKNSTQMRLTQDFSRLQAVVDLVNK